MTSIGDSVFKEFKGLTCVTLPDSITEIGVSAFDTCWSLPYIAIPNGVTTIREKAFYRCKSLNGILIPDSVTTVEDDAFSFVPLGYIYFGDNKAKRAAYNVINRQERYDKTEEKYFSKCRITERPDLRTESDAGSCGEVEWSYNDGVLTIQGVGRMDDYSSSDQNLPPWHKYSKEIRHLGIGGGVTHIGSDAFSGCTNLSAVTLTEDVTSIGNNAFSDCISLKRASIYDPYPFPADPYDPTVALTIGDKVFSGCCSLREVVIPFRAKESGYDVFSGCDRLETILHMGSETHWSGHLEGLRPSSTNVKRSEPEGAAEEPKAVEIIHDYDLRERRTEIW